VSPTPPDDPGNPSSDVRGERRTTATQASTTAPAARLDNTAQGQEVPLASLGHVLREKRHGLVVDTGVTQAPGMAEREAAVALAEAIPGQQRGTLGADTNSDPRDVVHERRVTPPVAPHTTGRSSAIAGRTTRHPGDAVRQRQGQCVAESVGWMKTIGRLRQTRYRDVARIGWLFTCAAAVYNLVRRRTLAVVA
jgi:hypothetical protein